MAAALVFRRELHIIAICVPKDRIIFGRHTEFVFIKRHVFVFVEPFPQIHVLDAPGEPDHASHESAVIVGIDPRELFERVLEPLLAAKPA